MRRTCLLLLLLTACGTGNGAGYEARGTVEVPEVDLSSMNAARVVTVRVDEGAAVQAGDTVAVLRQIDLAAQLEGLTARAATATAHLRDLEAGARPEEIRRAEAEVQAATAELDVRVKDLTRMRELASRDVISKQTLDNAVSAESVARGRLRSAEETLRLLHAGARPEQVSAARSELTSARAAIQQLQAKTGDLVVTAPVAGIILSRNAEPGEALAPNVPVLTLGEMGRPYVRVYVPQSVVATLQVGAATIVVIGEKGRSVPGKVAAIQPRAEFTPRVALTEQERADLMFGVKVEFANPADAPHPGLWVTVVFGS